MRRAVALIVIGLLALVAATAPQPAPAEITVPTSTTTTVPEPLAGKGFSNCPWAIASDVEETFFGLASVPSAELVITFPLAGEVRETVRESLPALGATSVRLGQYLAQGLAPATVEFTSSPAATTVLVSGPDYLAGAICPSSTPKIWHLPGGSTRAGYRLLLQLYNPFSEDATVATQVYSEFGSEPAPDLVGLVVPARSWRTLNLHSLLPAREVLGLIVSTEGGNVVPLLLMSPDSGGMAMWTGLGQAEIWEFPLVGTEAMSSELIVSNDGIDEITYELDVIGPEETTFGVETRTVVPLTEDRVALGDLSPYPFGVRVRADGPVAAVVVARGDTGLAAVPGATVNATKWLLPGVGAHPEAAYRLSILNPGVDPLTVTLSAISPGGTSRGPDKVSVPPGSVRIRTIDTLQVFGLLAEASTPFSIAWWADLGDDTAFVQGVPLQAQP